MVLRLLMCGAMPPFSHFADHGAQLIKETNLNLIYYCYLNIIRNIIMIIKGAPEARYLLSLIF
jgi:fluoride ion exporter CrcB/FEX